MLKTQLVNIVTEWDRKQSTRKGYNVYALGQYFKAIENVVKARENGQSIENALKVGFCGSLLRYVAKQLKLAVRYEKWE